MNNGVVLVAAVIIATALVWPQSIRSLSAKVAENFTVKKSHAMDKFEEIKRLVVDQGAKVYRCVEITPDKKPQQIKRLP